MLLLMETPTTEANEVYEFRVAGHLTNVRAGWFEDLVLECTAEGQTLLSGPVHDQAALHGYLARFRDLGLTLLSVNRLSRSHSMENSNQLSTLAIKTRLSVLWIFMFINVIIADVHRLFKPGFIDSMISGTVNGVEITEAVLLQAAIAIEIPILMIALAQLLPFQINRWVNISVGMLGIGYVLSNLLPGAR